MKTTLMSIAAVQAYGQLTENVTKWSGVKLYDTDGTTLIRDLVGQTGWDKVGTGASAVITYKMAMTMTSYGSDLPEDAGVFWAMPTVESTPANKIWESSLFLDYS